MTSIPEGLSADQVCILRRVLEHVLSHLPPDLQTTDNLSLITRRLVEASRAGACDEGQLCRTAFEGALFDRRDSLTALLPTAGRRQIMRHKSASGSGGEGRRGLRFLM